MQPSSKGKDMHPPQTLAGYIRQHLAEIEEKLEIGVRQEAIVSDLNDLGYETSVTAFRNYLYRARLRSAQKVASAPTKPQLPKDKTTVEKSTEKPTKEKSPLTQKAGFDFKGTNSVNIDDLV